MVHTFEFPKKSKSPEECFLYFLSLCCVISISKCIPIDVYPEERMQRLRIGGDAATADS